MPEITDISAGRHSVYQIVVSDDKRTVTIRETENHNHKVDLMSSVIPTLVDILRKLDL
jgi:hypothetical protein